MCSSCYDQDDDMVWNKITEKKPSDGEDCIILIVNKDLSWMSVCARYDADACIRGRGNIYLGDFKLDYTPYEDFCLCWTAIYWMAIPSLPWHEMRPGFRNPWYKSVMNPCKRKQTDQIKLIGGKNE